MKMKDALKTLRFFLTARTVSHYSTSDTERGGGREESETERQTETERQRDRDRETDRDRQTDRVCVSDTHTHTPET